MTPIKAALNLLKSLRPRETPNYAEISKIYSCDYRGGIKVFRAL